MKKLIFIITFLLCAFVSFGQLPNNQSVSNALTRYHIPNMKADSSIMFPIKDTLNNPATFYPGAMTVRPQDTIGHAIFPVYQSNGVYWTKVSSSIIITGLGIDSVTLYSGLLCQWQAGIATCWFLTPSTGGAVDSFHLSPDSLAIYQYRNGAFVDSIYLLHTYLYVNPIHFSLQTNYLFNPYAQLLNAERLVDTVFVTADSLYQIIQYANGDVDSIQWIGDGGGGGGGGSGTVTSVSRTNGLGITASVANPTTTPDITIAVDTSSASILSRQRAAATYAPIITLTTTGSFPATYSGVSGVLNIPTPSFAGLSDVNLVSIADGEVPIYNSSTSKWENHTSLAFSIAGLQDNDIFEYNSTSGFWENVQPAVQATAWAITGNAATVAGTNFVGTTDDVNLMFKRNGVVSGLIDSSSMFRSFFGYKTGNYATSTGIGNSGFGYFALKSNTTGNYNTAVGVQALELNTTGQYMSVLGYQAYGKNTTGLGYGVAIGYQSQFSLNTGNDNVSVGFQSQFTATSAADNVGIGYQTLYFNSTGSNNTGIGTSALHGNASYSNNTAIGMNALFNNTGNNNTAIGFDAVKGITSGTENVGIGYKAMGTTNAGTGSYNLALGSSALIASTTGGSNVALGRNTMFNSTETNYSISVGAQAGQYSYRIVDANGAPIDPLQKADTSIFIGNVASPLLDSQVNQIVIATWNGKGLGSHTAVIGEPTNTNVGIWGNLSLQAVGNKINIPEGSNGSAGQTVLVSGTKAITISGLTTSSRAFVTLVSPVGVTLTTAYQAVCTANTLTIQGNVAAGTINVADGSTLNYWVIN